MSMTRRFIDSSLKNIEAANQSPISGYLDFPILPLEETLTYVSTIVPSLTKTLFEARKLCNRTSTLVTSDESAAIYLYTMQTIFFEQLNKALREENRQALKPWFRFIRLFMSALEKLPSISDIVWRGLSVDIGSSYKEHTELTWWSFNSCSRSLNVVEAFVGPTGTLFGIGCTNGKDISEFSAKRDEDEIVLMPGTRLLVKSYAHANNNLRIFHIIEYDRDEQLQLKIEQHRNNATVFFYNNELSKDTSTDLICEELRQNRTWKVLCLSFNKKIKISRLAEALVNQSILEELDLNGVSLGANGAVILAHSLNDNRCLTILRLAYNSISYRGAIALAEMLRTNSSLQFLFLTSNVIGDEGCKALCDSLRENAALLYLSLDDNSITKNSLESIGYMLQHNLTLTILVLCSNPIVMNVDGRLATIEAAGVNNTCTVNFFLK